MSEPTEMVLLRGVVLPRSEVRAEYSRAGGPGGQHVNRTETRVTLRFNLQESPSIPDVEREGMVQKLAPRLTKAGEVLVSVERHRDRVRNLATAYQRLTELLIGSMERPRQRKKTRPTRASQQKRLDQKKALGDRKRRRRPPGRDE